MLKLRTYLYSKRGEFLSSKQLSKASWFRLTSKASGIDELFLFPSKSKVQEKLDYIQYIKDEFNKSFFQVEEKNSLFTIEDDWQYITFDKDSNELFEPLGKKSKFFTLFKDLEPISSDYFPKRLSPSEKLDYLEKIIDSYLFEQEEQKKLSEEVFHTSKKYYSKKIERQATSHNIVIRFENNPSWSVFREELRTRIFQHAKDARSDLMLIRNSKKDFMWQFVACIVPVDGNGNITHEHKQFISSSQLSNFKMSYEEMIEQIDSLDDVFTENYKLDFENAEVGFREFTLCLIQ